MMTTGNKNASTKLFSKIDPLNLEKAKVEPSHPLVYGSDRINYDQEVADHDNLYNNSNRDRNSSGEQDLRA